MGAYFTKLFSRLFDFPIKRKPICYFRQEDFKTTGEILQVSEETTTSTEMASFQTEFYTLLLALRNAARESRETEDMAHKYPGWDEMTISNMHSLFLLFNNNVNGMLNFTNFSAILESLGDDNTHDVKKLNFDAADKDNDGWLSYDEFVNLMYYMNPPVNGELRGVAKLCVDMAANIKFVSSLSVGEQLEYGLF